MPSREELDRLLKGVSGLAVGQRWLDRMTNNQPVVVTRTDPPWLRTTDTGVSFTCNVEDFFIWGRFDYQGKGPPVAAGPPFAVIEDDGDPD